MSEAAQNPFKAIRPYTRSKRDRETFFGRDEDFGLVMGRLQVGRTVLLFAGSGVGKTSFLEAKLIPALQEHWAVLSYREWSTQNPGVGLKEHIVELGATQEGKLRLLVLDQFEELLQNHRDTRVLAEIVKTLAELINAPAPEVRVLFSMREEFLGELSVFDNKIPDLFNNYYRLKNPRLRMAASIIVSICAQVKIAEKPVDADEDKVDELVAELARVHSSFGAVRQEDLQRDWVAFPFLQIVCFRLWEREKPGGPVRFASSYKDGDAKGLLQEYVEEKLNLSVHQKELAADAFGFLITKQGAKVPYELEVLAEQLGAKPTVLAAILDELSAADVRILRRIDLQGGAVSYELYHDIYAPFLLAWRSKFDKERHEELQAHAAKTGDILNKLRGREQNLLSKMLAYLVDSGGTIRTDKLTDLAKKVDTSNEEVSALVEKLSTPEFRILRVEEAWVEPYHEVLGLPLGEWRKQYARQRRARWLQSISAAAPVLLLAAPLAWWGWKQVSESEQVMRAESSSFIEKRDASTILRLSPWHSKMVHQYWKAFWRQKADEAERNEDRDAAILYRLQEIVADPDHSDEARRKAAWLTGDSYQFLTSTTYRPVAPQPYQAAPRLRIPAGWPVRENQLLTELAAFSQIKSGSDSRYLTIESDTYARFWDSKGQPLTGLILASGLDRPKVTVENNSTTVTGEYSQGMRRTWNPDPEIKDVTERLRAWLFETVPGVSALLEQREGRSIKVLASSGNRSLAAGFPVRQVRISAEGRYLAASGQGRTVRLWDLGRGDTGTQLPHAEPNPGLVGFSADGRFLATRTEGSSYSFCRVWRTADNEEITVLPRCNGLVFQPSREVIAMDEFGGSVSVRRLVDTGGTEEAYRLSGNPTFVLGFSADGKWLITRGSGKVAVRDADNGNVLKEVSVDAGNSVDHVVFGSDTSRMTLVMARIAPHLPRLLYADEVVFAEGNLTRKTLPNRYVVNAFYAPDGKSLFVAGQNWLHRYDAGSGSESHRPLKGSWAGALRFSDKGGLKLEIAVRTAPDVVVAETVSFNLSAQDPIKPDRGQSWQTLLEDWRKRLGMIQESSGFYTPDYPGNQGSRGGRF